MGTREEFKENPIRFIKNIAMDVVVVIVALAYVFYNMIKLEPTDTNILVLIAQAIVGIICGVVIKQALGENGFSKGYNSKEWIEENDKYNNACNDAVNYTDRVDNFYLELEIEKKENYRRSHLQAARLRYEDWFNTNGDYIGREDYYKKLKLLQKITVRKCIRVKIYVLNLFSEYSVASEQDTKREATDGTQRKKTFTKNTLSAVLIAIIGVYFIPGLDKWSWASFISATMQVSLWVLFGILQLYTNYDFVVHDRVAIVRKKKELLGKFVTNCEKNMYTKNPYRVQEDNKVIYLPGPQN